WPLLPWLLLGADGPALLRRRHEPVLDGRIGAVRAVGEGHSAGALAGVALRARTRRGGRGAFYCRRLGGWVRASSKRSGTALEPQRARTNLGRTMMRPCLGLCPPCFATSAPGAGCGRTSCRSRAKSRRRAPVARRECARAGRGAPPSAPSRRRARAAPTAGRR